MSLDINGLDQFMNEIDNMIITENDKNSVLNKAVEPLFSSIKDEANSFKKTGELAGSIKKNVKGGQATVTSNKKHAWILEYSPKYGHVGWFSSAIEDAEAEVLKIIEDNLFK